jgi:protein involved in temperature-dependent protein secretion
VSSAARVAKDLAVADAGEIASDVAVQLAELQGRVVEAVKLLTCGTRYDWWPDSSAAGCGLCSNCWARALLSGDAG